MQARSLKLHPKTAEKLYRLKKEAERSGEYRVAKRVHAVLLNHQGKTSGEIAQLFQAPRSCVSQWLSVYACHGYEGLLEGQRSGRIPELNDKQKTELADIVESGPVAYGFLSGVWTSPMVTRVIAEVFGVFYHPGHVRKLLDILGFSVQRPKRLLAKADPHAQNRWRRYRYPNIKKKPAPKEPISFSKTKPASAKMPRSTKRGPFVGTSR